MTDQQKIEIARECADYELKYIHKLNNIPNPWKPTIEEFKAAILKKHPLFKVDNQVVYIFNLLLLFFNGDPEFEAQGYDLNKGILLAGGVGFGKTELLRIFQSNPRCSYTEVNCSNVSDDFAKDGFEVIEKYSTVRTGIRNLFGQTQYGLFLDDIGTDEYRKNFGNSTNVVADILTRRYNNKVPNIMTHGTTNLTGEQMRLLYGERLTSRILGMWNIISFAPGSVDRRR